MWPRLVVFADPHIKIGLQLVNGTVHLFAEGDAVKLTGVVAPDRREGIHAESFLY
jgi:hypothetical protein